jgi:hypothetical protein
MTRKLAKNVLDLNTCVLHKQNFGAQGLYTVKIFSEDLWALHLWHAKMDGVKILKMVYEDKEILVNLDLDSEILDAYNKLDEILKCDMSYRQFNNEFDRMIMPIIEKAYS